MPGYISAIQKESNEDWRLARSHIAGTRLEVRAKGTVVPRPGWKFSSAKSGLEITNSLSGRLQGFRRHLNGTGQLRLQEIKEGAFRKFSADSLQGQGIQLQMK